MALVERFLDYVSYDTQSSEVGDALPSTPGQLVLAQHLAEELRALGAKDVYLSPGAYVYATIPASAPCADQPALGFLAHLDTAPDASGANVKPRLVKYAGGVLSLGNSGRALDPAVFPELGHLAGKTLIVTDGTTLLGADDKAGVAIAMELAATLLAAEAPAHREIRLCFTPDEEIGLGTRGFEPARFGAKVAFTLDGGEVSAVEGANFNAARAKFSIAGVSVHPGSAKDAMVNAIKIAGEILAALPEREAPEHTEAREGFFHPTGISGTVSAATLECIVRDHDRTNFERRKNWLRELAAKIAETHPTAKISVEIKDQYYNMEDKIAEVPWLMEEARAAIRSVGLEPHDVAVRGGTDGAALSYMGIPCPNLGTGGRNYHGECEYAIVEEMEQALAIVLHLAQN